MLTIKPVCENCGKLLPNDSGEGMICSLECTFCSDCVQHVLENVCPNCGGGFEKRPTRPVTCKTKFCVSNYPVSTEPYIKPVVEKDFKALQDYFKQIDPRKR